jgi:alpha-beta hydrolase superfamily lysophospholipase
MGNRGLLKNAHRFDLKFYKDGRHEMLNEINRDEVFKDVIAWMNKHV